jgi:hypothetical protein
MQVELGPTRDLADVVAWRRDQLVDSGFPAALAAELAGDRRFDLHALVELVERGCPPEIAVRIHAPLEGTR